MTDFPNFSDKFAKNPCREFPAPKESDYKARRLFAIIERLALIPAPDFYRTGDYACGLVEDAWREARDLMYDEK